MMNLPESVLTSPQLMKVPPYEFMARFKPSDDEPPDNYKCILASDIYTWHKRRFIKLQIIEGERAGEVCEKVVISAIAKDERDIALMYYRWDQYTKIF